MNKMEMKKRFIEYDMPLAEISEESAREKNIRHGHPSTLHIWWARRPLAASRATAFAALIDLPEDREKREEIKEVIAKMSPWEEVKNGNGRWIKKAKKLLKEQWGDNPPRVIDPFSGGGSIPLEALRLGCETHANDLNPVAVFIEKATLEWPQKFGVDIPNPEQEVQQSFDGPKKVNFLSYMVEKWANKILEEAKEEIGRFYPCEPDGSIPVGYIWARTIPCQNPSCGAEIPLVRQFWLAKKEKKKVAYKPVVDRENRRVDFVIQEGAEIDFDPGEGTITRGNAQCPICGQVTKAVDVKRLAREGKMGERLIVVVLHKPGVIGKKYRIATEKDMSVFRGAEKYLEEKVADWPYLDSPVPDEPTPAGKGRGAERAFSIGNYGLNTWGDLFNSRQKLALITFMDKIKKSYEGIKEDCAAAELKKYGLEPDEAAKAVMGYLGVILGRLADKNANIVVYNVYGEKIEHVFGRQALGMVWDYSELNVFSGVNGDWKANRDWVVLYLNKTILTNGKTHVTQSSATSLSFPDNHFDAVLTDPPYYDNVPYSHLSDFFYVWLKRSVGDLFPDIFATPTTPKSNEIVAYTHEQSWEEAKGFFENMLSGSFKEIHRILKPGGVAVIVYAHKTTSGWETMLNSLVNAGLVVTASWPLHTEMKTRLRAAASAALASSIYMVCRKIGRKEVGYYSEIQPLIKERIEEKLQQFWNAKIVGGDFFISAIGPAMEVFSKYEKVEKYSGKRVTTADLLDYIRTISTDWIVNQLLKGASSGSIDSESHFYLTYRWTYLDNTVPFDDARKLASAAGVNLEDLWKKGGFVKKMGDKIKVLNPKERDTFKINNMVDVMHKTLLLWENGKRDEINELLSSTGYGASPAFWQLCQAVAESLTNGNKEKQLLGWFLMGKDSYISESATRKQKALDDFQKISPKSSG